MSRLPCPCCGYLTLDEGPGAYDLCPVCFWEDDLSQLRYPMSPDGPNGISLAEAQGAYQRHGVVDKAFLDRVRPPRPEEPRDQGWRPFDPARDWSDPILESDRWPVNAEALYYWRPTFWNGDQHKLPLPPREPTNDDRFLDHLRQVPELAEAVAGSERRWGRASSFDVCGAASVLALAAYRQGDDETGLRIVTALLPAVETGSATYVPNAVVIAFLENQGWHEPWVQPYVDRWPAPIRESVREQQAYRRRGQAEEISRQEEWADLLRSGRGRPVGEIVNRLRARQTYAYDNPVLELGLESSARWISDPWWLYRHPVDSFRLAWRYRAVQGPWRTIAGLRGLRFVAG